MDVQGPFLKYNCSECGYEITYKVSPRRIEQELEEMRERENRFCAMCSYAQKRYGE